MLVLARRKHERIRIGDDVYVTIVSIREGVVRIGVEAPLNIPVVRTELDDCKEQHNGTENCPA